MYSIFLLSPRDHRTTLPFWPFFSHNSGDFTLREGAKSWPLLCHIDTSSDQWQDNVSHKLHILSYSVSIFALG